MTDRNDGIVLLNKDPGITSFRSLNQLKKIFNTNKIGHTGTLDKFAEGLIIVLTGKFTKLAQYFTNLDKEYIAVFEFGIETSTIDPEGEILENNAAIPELSDIMNIIDNFKGIQLQVPPNFSAVHINGKRAYKIALKGDIPDIPPREIIIHEIELISYSKPFLELRISCSKGTYIRSLARDIAAALGTKAYVKELKRTRVGSFAIENSVKASDITFDDLITGKECFSNIEGINTINIKPEYIEHILKGGKLHKKQFSNEINKNGLYAVFDKNHFFALILFTDGNIEYKFVIPSKME